MAPLKKYFSVLRVGLLWGLGSQSQGLREMLVESEIGKPVIIFDVTVHSAFGPNRSFGIPSGTFVTPA